MSKMKVWPQRTEPPVVQKPTLTTRLGWVLGDRKELLTKIAWYSDLHYIPLPRNFRTRRLRAEAHRGIRRRHRQ